MSKENKGLLGQAAQKKRNELDRQNAQRIAEEKRKAAERTRQLAEEAQKKKAEADKEKIKQVDNRAVTMKIKLYQKTRWEAMKQLAGIRFDYQMIDYMMDYLESNLTQEEQIKLEVLKELAENK